MAAKSTFLICLTLVIALEEHVLAQSCSSIKTFPDECGCVDLPSSDVTVTCDGLSKNSDIQTALDNAKNCVHFTLKNANIPSLPLGITHNLLNLSIVNTRMPYISPPLAKDSTALDGLKNLYRIRLEKVNDIKDWQWHLLENLTNLKVLYILGGSLAYIPKEFSKVGGSNLEELVLEKCGLKNIAEGGLAFPNVKFLQIKDDPIEYLHSNMFHKESKIETFIVYGLNLLQGLPEDVFWNMKGLKRFVTDETLFPYLTENHFKGITLDDFSLYISANIQCDCKFTWLFKHTIQNLGDCLSKGELTDFEEFLKSC